MRHSVIQSVCHAINGGTVLIPIGVIRPYVVNGHANEFMAKWGIVDVVVSDNSAGTLIQPAAD